MLHTVRVGNLLFCTNSLILLSKLLLLLLTKARPWGIRAGCSWQKCESLTVALLWRVTGAICPRLLFVKSDASKLLLLLFKKEQLSEEQIILGHKKGGKQWKNFSSQLLVFESYSMESWAITHVALFYRATRVIRSWSLFFMSESLCHSFAQKKRAIRS